MHCWQLKLPIHQNGPLLASYCYLLFFVEWYLGIWCEEPRTWAFCAVGVKLIHFCTVGSCKLQTCIAVMGAKLRITSQVLTYYLAWNLKAPLIWQCFSMFFCCSFIAGLSECEIQRNRAQQHVLPSGSHTMVHLFLIFFFWAGLSAKENVCIDQIVKLLLLLLLQC